MNVIGNVRLWWPILVSWRSISCCVCCFYIPLASYNICCWRFWPAAISHMMMTFLACTRTLQSHTHTHRTHMVSHSWELSHLTNWKQVTVWFFFIIFYFVRSFWNIKFRRDNWIVSFRSKSETKVFWFCWIFCSHFIYKYILYIVIFVYTIDIEISLISYSYIFHIYIFYSFYYTIFVI